MERPQEHAGLSIEQTSTEAWDCWLNEEFKLDSDSPMDISDSMWDDFAQSNETVARSLFVKATSSDMKEGSAQTSSSWHHSSLTSEGMLNLLADEHVSSSPCLSESFEGCDDSFANTCQDLPSSTTPMWFMPKEDSLCSSPSSVHVEQSAESWMAECFNDDDDDVHLQEIAQHGSILSDSMAPPFSQMRAHGAPCRVRHGRRGAGTSQEFLATQNGSITKKLAISRGKQVPTNKLVRSVSDSQVVQESSKPVVYPFALVKPSGIQGDATLKDINERINMFSSPPSRHSNTPHPSTSSPFSGKPVVAVTKIHTEGKGTITIMRTRS